MGWIIIEYIVCVDKNISNLKFTVPCPGKVIPRAVLIVTGNLVRATVFIATSLLFNIAKGIVDPIKRDNI